MESPQKLSLTPGACNALDVAKMLFAIVVVGIHQPIFSGDAYVATWLWMGRLAVPFFFITSAFLFFLRNPGPTELKKYVVRMLKLYGVWFVVMLPYTIQLRYVADYSVAGNIAHFLQLFLLDSTFRGSWFLSALLLSIPLVYYGERKLGMRWMLAIAVVVELFLLSYAWRFAMPTSVADALTAFTRGFPDVHCSFLAAMIYVVIGCIIARKWNVVSQLSVKRLWAAAIVLTAVMAAWIIVKEKCWHISTRTLLLVPAVTAIFLAVVRSEVNLKLPYCALRKTSTIVYISHFLFIFLLSRAQMYWWHSSLPDFARFAIVLGVSCALPALLIQLQKRPRMGWLKYTW